MQRLDFSKYSGCGNDFILIDNRSGAFPSDDKKLIKSLCQRRLGIGADGILLLENSTNANFRMRIFNADASEAEMCGNGLRCFGKFLRERGIPGKNFYIEVMGNTYPLELKKNLVKATMPPPTQTKWEVEFSLEDNSIIGDFLDTGVPHIVIFTDELENIDLADLGPKIRHHPHFSPRGTNVNFATQDNEGNVKIRTYERGVEEETLACGTGAAAVSIAAARKWKLKGPITVIPRSGEQLQFYLEKGHIAMSGPAQFIFRGEIPLY